MLELKFAIYHKSSKSDFTGFFSMWYQELLSVIEVTIAVARRVQ